jgi:predicted DNA-binding transcriptional regulator AlpA
MRSMHTAASPADLITEIEAASLLGVSPRTLQAWRYRARGPRFVRLSTKSVRYRRSDLDAFVSSCVRQSTREAGA